MTTIITQLERVTADCYDYYGQCMDWVSSTQSYKHHW